MRAMILAAGRGERMQHLTLENPKPLLKLYGNYLIEYSIRALAQAGIKEVVINVCYKADMIQETLGNGARYGVDIVYSVEQEALETGGGIFQALPLLGKDPFIVISCDVVTDYDLRKLQYQQEGLAHLVLVNNPDFRPQGDFCLRDKTICLGDHHRYTFASMGVYHPELFAHCKPGRFRLGDVLKTAILQKSVTGELYDGFWQNIGTPEQIDNCVALPECLR